MRPDDLTELDPLVFVRSGIELLPAEGPLNAEGFGVLQAIGSGLLRITVAIGAEIAALDYRLRHGSTSIADVAGEVALLEALTARGEVARARLHSFTAEAAQALGITHDTKEKS